MNLNDSTAIAKNQPLTCLGHRTLGIPVFGTGCSGVRFPCRVLSIAPRSWAIDRFSRACQEPTRTLANQNAATHLWQLGRLSIRYVFEAQCEF